MKVFNFQQVHGVTNAGTYILNVKLWVVIPDYVLEGEALPHQLKHTQNRDPGTRYARFSKVSVWIDGNSLFHFPTNYLWPTLTLAPFRAQMT